MTLEARQGITPHIRRLLAQKILRPCQLACNTPLLSVKKPNSHDYRPVQDLREVNRGVLDIHSMVPNPYNLELAPARSSLVYSPRSKRCFL